MHMHKMHLPSEPRSERHTAVNNTSFGAGGSCTAFVTSETHGTPQGSGEDNYGSPRERQDFQRLADSSGSHCEDTPAMRLFSLEDDCAKTVWTTPDSRTLAITNKESSNSVTAYTVIAVIMFLCVAFTTIRTSQAQADLQMRVATLERQLVELDVACSCERTKGIGPDAGVSVKEHRRNKFAFLVKHYAGKDGDGVLSFPLNAQRNPSFETSSPPASSLDAGGPPASSLDAGGIPASSLDAGGPPASSLDAGGPPASSLDARGPPASSLDAGGPPASSLHAGGIPAIDAGRKLPAIDITTPEMHPKDKILLQSRKMGAPTLERAPPVAGGDTTPPPPPSVVRREDAFSPYGAERRVRRSGKRASKSRKRSRVLDDSGEDGRGRSGTGRGNNSAEVLEIKGVHFQANLNRTTTIGVAGWVPHWTFSPSMTSEDYTREFRLSPRGNVTVRTPGMYYIYSQIMYYDPNEYIGHSIVVNGVEAFTCIAPIAQQVNKYKTCFIGGLVHVPAKARVGIKMLYTPRQVCLFEDTSFFGMFRISSSASLPNNT